MSVELDARVRRHVYESACESGRLPVIAETSSALRLAQQEIRGAFDRLAAGRMLVLQPDGEILMAEPFSAVPTPFLVEAAGFTGDSGIAHFAVPARDWWNDVVFT